MTCRASLLRRSTASLAGGLAVAVVCSFGALAGCGAPDAGLPNTSQIPERAENEFDRAIELIEQAEDFDPEQARREAVNQLNRWIDNEEQDAGWIADPLTGRLPAQLRNTALVRDLGAMQFNIPDGRYLQQSAWLRDLARFIREQGEDGAALDPLSNTMLEQTRGPDGAPLPEEVAEQLELALRLFDWTVRNIQLDAAPELPTDAAARAVVQANAPGRGEAGPGYTLFPWQVLQFGHGDWQQRAHLFLLLCHQAGIDGTLLAIEEPDGALPRPWAPAVLIGGQLYLFDAALGLPIPGPVSDASPGPPGVATLAQVVNDPNLLRALDFTGAEGSGDAFVYPVTAEDLARVVALVAAPAESLSQRMRLLELKLAGEKKIALTMVPASLAQKLKPMPEIKNTLLWTAPFNCFVYRIAIEQQGQSNPALLAQKLKEDKLFGSIHPLVLGRRLHLRGELDQRDTTAADAGEAGALQAGAKGYYMRARMNDREIATVKQSEEMQKQLQLDRAPGESQADWEVRFEGFARFIRETRPYANYWMGLVHYENRSFDTASTWLSNQVLKESDATPWLAGAQYNLARARESQGDTPAAITGLREGQSPQRHGNLLRAQWLDEHGGKDPASE